MSAFIVGKAHIDALVQAGLAAGRHSRLTWTVDKPEWTGAANHAAYVLAYKAATRELRSDTADRVGAMLWNENIKSVDHRYEDHTDREVYTFPVMTKTRKPVEILKALACYEYQSCEHPEWEASEAKAFCDVLRDAMINALPGYEQAAWEIPA